MNDYLCAVLLHIETYLQASKYNSIQCGDTGKIPKALVDACSITGAFLMYKFHPFKVQRMTSIKSSLFAMWFTSYKLKRIKQDRPYILIVKGIKPDINWTLLNRWKRVFLELVTRHQPKLAYETNFIPMNGQTNFIPLLFRG